MANPVQTAVLASVCAAITTVAAWSLLSFSRNDERVRLTSSRPVAAPAAEPTEPIARPAQAAPVEIAAAPLPAVDPAAFGALPATLAPPAPPPRPSLLDKPAAFASVAPPLQSLAESFAQSPLEAVLPGARSGPSPLDGPADAGIATPVIEADLAQPNPPTGKVIALDASEGTKLDPLRQRAWDLNATQVVPPLLPSR